MVLPGGEQVHGLGYIHYDGQNSAIIIVFPPKSVGNFQG